MCVAMGCQGSVIAHTVANGGVPLVQAAAWFERRSADDVIPSFRCRGAARDGLASPGGALIRHKNNHTRNAVNALQHDGQLREAALIHFSCVLSNSCIIPPTRCTSCIGLCRRLQLGSGIDLAAACFMGTSQPTTRNILLAVDDTPVRIELR